MCDIDGVDITQFLNIAGRLAEEAGLARSEIRFYRKLYVFWYTQAEALRKDRSVSVLRTATHRQLLSELWRRVHAGLSDIFRKR